jgi:putative heme-binding domain-containing protein
LPAESEELERLLADAIAGATDDALETTVEAGRAVFDKNCTACHQAAGQGKLVGPQLDGVGTRGLPRVAEDVFAPYRNVDESFRTTVLNLSDGRVLTGLVRERKADEWIVVDATGKPQTIPASLIEESRTSASSIMPDNFGQTLTPADRTALLRYLLSLREQRP